MPKGRKIAAVVKKLSFKEAEEAGIYWARLVVSTDYTRCLN